VAARETGRREERRKQRTTDSRDFNPRLKRARPLKLVTAKLSGEMKSQTRSQGESARSQRAMSRAENEILKE